MAEPTPAKPSFWPVLTTRRLMTWVAGLALVLGVLIMLTPVVGHSPEPGRRSLCINNLRLIGMAILEYEDQTGTFPVGTVANPDLPLERRLGWNYRLTFNLEIKTPVPADDPTRAHDDPVFRPLRSNPPSVEICPTFRRKDIASYLGVAGLGLDSPALPKEHPRAGVFGDDRVVASADIVDGRSNTMVVLESSKNTGPWLAGGRATVRGLDPTHPPYIGPDGQFGGIHPGGLNVLMADGSVKFVKDTVDPKVFEAMSTIAGGEKVSVPWEN